MYSFSNCSSDWLQYSVELLYFMDLGARLNIQSMHIYGYLVRRKTLLWCKCGKGIDNMMTKGRCIAWVEVGYVALWFVITQLQGRRLRFQGWQPCGGQAIDTMFSTTTKSPLHTIPERSKPSSCVTEMQVASCAVLALDSTMYYVIYCNSDRDLVVLSASQRIVNIFRYCRFRGFEM